MALTIKTIGFGQVNQTGGQDLSSAVQSGKAQIVKAMRFVNTNTSSSVILNVLLTHGGTDRQISPKNMSLAPGAAYIDDTEVTLETNDKIRGSVSSGGTVDYVISGIERDA
jgi:hypothetical protein